MRKPRSFYCLIKRFPPCLVRLLARSKHGPPLEENAIALAGSLPMYEVVALSQMTDWKGVSVDTIQKFTHGCGLDLDNPASIKRKTSYLSGQRINGVRTPMRFSYLKRSPRWDSFYKPLIQRWRQSVYGN